MTPGGTLEQQVPPAARRPRTAAVVEIVASLVASGTVVLIVLHYVGVHLTFFGAPVVIREDDVQRYWVLVSVLAAAMLVSVAAAGWRRARGSFVWHGVVAVAGVLVATTFPVTEVGELPDQSDPAWSERPEPSAPSDPVGGAVCRSGGDSDECVGG